MHMHNTMPIHEYNANECACRLHLMKKKDKKILKKKKQKRKMLTNKPVFHIA